MSHIHPYRGVHPRIDAEAFIAPSASVIGEVTIGAESSVWFGAVLRGDVMPIRVGERTSIQDNAVVHATGGWWPVDVGSDCVIGHGVILHGCTVADRVLVGMGSVLLDEVEIGAETIIGAGSLLPPRMKIPSGVLCLGRPAKIVRELREADLASIRDGAEIYVGKCREYLEAMGRAPG
ncbi:MAG: gamma carbonic anhydrase family protein [Myxococcales bacterium]|nr:gamma carbonic anhydrase family protein [Myxococcales bacterium]